MSLKSSRTNMWLSRHFCNSSSHNPLNRKDKAAQLLSSVVFSGTGWIVRKVSGHKYGNIFVLGAWCLISSPLPLHRHDILILVRKVLLQSWFGNRPSVTNSPRDCIQQGVPCSHVSPIAVGPSDDTWVHFSSFESSGWDILRICSWWHTPSFPFYNFHFTIPISPLYCTCHRFNTYFPTTFSWIRVMGWMQTIGYFN